MTDLPIEPRAFQVPPHSFSLGAFTLMHLPNGKIWIRYKTGEAGEFNAEDLEAVVYEYFWESF